MGVFLLILWLIDIYLSIFLEVDSFLLFDFLDVVFFLLMIIESFSVDRICIFLK